MKKILLGLLIMSVSAIASAKGYEICVAQKKLDAWMPNWMKFEISCGKEQFSTSGNLSNILSPLPLNPKAMAMSKLYTKMAERGMKQVGFIKEPSLVERGIFGELRIFEKIPVKNATYCTALRFNKFKLGTEQLLVSDVILKCPDGYEEYFSGEPKSLINGVMAEKGYTPVLLTPLDRTNLQVRGFLAAFDDVIIYRKFR